jgi:uncharacterized repeat protein (TIGR01451 family)
MRKGACFHFLVLVLFGLATAQAQTTGTITTLSATTNVSCLGQPVTFTAVVTSNPAGAGTPTGTVYFQDGATVIDTETLDASGTATFSTASLTAGSHSITAQYNGDPNFNASTSTVVTETINTPPAVNVSPASQTICVGNTVTFTASASGTPTPGLQWQVSTDGGATFTAIPGATAGTYAFTVGLSDSGKQYRASFTNSCGSAASSPATLTVAPKPTAVVSGTPTICAGNTAAIQAALTGTPPWTVGWSDGAISNNVAASPFTRFVSPSSTTTYTVTSLSDANCTGTASGSATVTVNPLPTVTTNPTNKTVCAGNSVSFAATATGTPALTVQWQVSTDGGATFVNVPNATSTTYTFATSGTDNAKQFRAQFANTCATIASAAATLTVNALPVCSISGADALCASSLNNTYFGPAGLAAYRWSVTGSATLSGATNGPSVTVNAGASGTFTLTLALTNSSGCTSTCSKPVSILPLPTAVVSGTATICAGNTAAIQAALTGTPPWTVGWSDGAISNNVAASPFTRFVSPSSTTIYTITSLSDANCTGTASGSATVTVNPLPTVTTNPANKAVCVGNSVSFSATATGTPAPTVQWQVSTDGGATFVNVPNATNNTYTFATSGTDNAKQFRAQFTNTCAGVASAAATLTVNALPICSISGAGAVCASSLNNSYFGPAGLAAYRWSVTGSATLGGATNGPSVNVNAGASGTFTLTLALTNSSGCSSTCSQTVTILPLPTAIVSGGGAICPGNTANIQATLTGTGPWTLIWSDGFTQSNVAASPATRTVSPASTTVYSVTTVTDANCSNAGSGSATVTANSPPAVTANPANKAVCAGSSVSFSASAAGTPTPGVQWQVSLNGGATFTYVAGATSSTYSFTAALSDSGKSFRAVFTNACGTATSTAASLVVNALPSAAITADPVVCGGSTGNLASVPSAGVGAGYAWTVSGGTIASGAGTSTITYTAGGSGTISISVTVTNAQGCSASGSQAVTLAAQGRTFDAWRNKAPLQWQSSTFNLGSHQYSDGNSIPMRLKLTQTCAGASWCVVLRYDFVDGNTPRHFYDFLDTYNASEPTVNGHECDTFNCSGSPTTFPIPADSSLSYQLPGYFTVFNGAITNVSTYSVISGSTIQKQLILSGVAASGGGAKDVLILFGGHLARENEWGAGNGASSFPGASAKVNYQFCGESSFGNFDVNPAGIVKQADLAITKTAAPNPLCAGNTLVYSLVVTNSGPDQASPVTVLDPLPAGTSLSSVSLSQGTWSGTTTLNFALGAINAGSNATITIMVTVNTNAGSSTLTNTATVSATAPADPYLLNNTATAISLVFPHPGATPLSDQVVCPGGSASFSTVAIGAPPFNYQWMHNGVIIPGATTSSYYVPSAGPSDAGSYCVIVSCQCNGVSDTVTNCASLIFSSNVSTSPMADLVKCPGDNATFSTVPAGTGPFTFIWTKDGVPLPGATLNSLTVTNVGAADAGAYCVQVTGFCGATNSCAMLSIRTNTAATALLNQTNCPGDTVTFTTIPSGSGPFTFVWRKDGALLPGNTGSSLTLSSLTAAQAGNYCVEVTGGCNSVTNCATLTVRTPTTADPLLSQTNCPGTSASFSTTAHGDGPFAYQWTKNGAPLPGQTASSITMSNLAAADAGTYAVQVTGLCNSTTNIATLTVNQNVLVASASSSLTNCPGTSAGFSVTAGGTGPFNYQWSKDGVAISAATASSLTVPSVSATDAGTYSVVLSGACGNPITNSATLTVNQNVQVSSAPLSLTNCPGTSAGFNVLATGTALTYQWYKNGSPLAGQTTSSFTLPSVSATDAATYSVVVSGACGNPITNIATLTVNQNVQVSSAPLSLTNCPGTSASFNVIAGGTGPFSYQWSKNGLPMSGATTSSLTLPSVSASDAATYTVIVSGTCGNAVTNSATLTVNENVQVSSAPVSLTNCPATTATFNVIATGTALTYQWSKNGSPMAGQTTSSLVLPSVNATNAGTYAVIVSGACGNAITNSATLTVNQNVQVSSAPLSLTNCPGTTATFNVIATGTALTYQWSKNGSAMPGQTSSSLVLPSVSATNAGTYTVVVSGACGNAVTNSATLTVNQNVQVSSAPVSLTNCPSTSATFNVIATGTGLSYQWYKGGSAMAGQTTSSLILPSVSSTDAATYTVIVSGTCGNPITNGATLTVNTSTTADPFVSQTTCAGTTIGFSTIAHGTGPFSYQWLKDGSPLSGQTASSLLLSNVVPAQTGTYAVRVTGACNSITNSATLTVNTLTTADGPITQAVCPGAALSLTVAAHGTGPFSYQWVKDGKPLPGATTSAWNIPSATVLDQGTYVVTISGACNTVTNIATLTVHPPTTATPLASQTLCFGTTATFSTVPSGTGPFTFLWRKNDLLLSGQTDASLTLTQLKAADAGTYAVEVYGFCNSVTNSATLAVESDGLVSPATFANPVPITINDFSAATPYPSSIQVSCVPTTPALVTVTLTNLSHTYASDISILLVGPNGQGVMLMCDAGAGNPVTNAILTFSDAAPGFLPATTRITTGVYKPTNYDTDDLMPVPAPLGPYQTNLSTFFTGDPNGTWSLYVVDDALMDTGIIAGGWSLTLAWQSVAVAAQLSAPVLMSDGCSQVSLQGQQGKTYTIQASTDLRSWTPIATNTLNSSLWNFVDSHSTNFTQRFYRAVWCP